MKKIKKFFIIIYLIFKERTWDFPFPPKKIVRLLSPSFWKTALYLYQRRKLETLDYDSKIKNFWKDHDHSQAIDYSDWLVSIFQKQWNVFMNKKIFDQILIKNPRNFFEAGCGSGHTAVCFLSYIDKYNLGSIDYHGIDLSKVRVQCAKEFVPRFIKSLNQEINLSFDVQDLENLPFKDNNFDVTLIPSVLERVDNESIESVLKEICRVTKDDIYISDFYDQYPRGYPRTPKNLEKIFLKYNFKIANEDYAYTSNQRNYCELHLHLTKV